MQIFMTNKNTNVPNEDSLMANINNKDGDVALGERVRSIRKYITQSAFADILGVTQGTIAKLEKGMAVRSELLKKIADYGKVSVDWLLTGENPFAIGVGEIDPDTILHICFERGIFKDKPDSERQYGFKGYIGNDAKLMRIFDSLMEKVCVSNAKIDVLKEMLEEERTRKK